MKRDGQRLITPMLIVIIALGSTDLLFALDSIPAIYGLTQEPYLVFTANVFALMGLRQLYFLLGGLLRRLVYLSLGLSVILAFIGVKLVFHAMHEYHLDERLGIPFSLEIPIWLSLAFIIVTLTITTVASLVKSRYDADNAAARRGGGRDRADRRSRPAEPEPTRRRSASRASARERPTDGRDPSSDPAVRRQFAARASGGQAAAVAAGAAGSIAAVTSSATSVLSTTSTASSTSAGTSSRSGSLRLGRNTVVSPARWAASSFCLAPPIGSTRPFRVTSPVIPTSERTGRPRAIDVSAVTMVTPADGPSFGTAPAGTWMWMCRSKIARSVIPSRSAWARTYAQAICADSFITSPS